MTGKLIASAWHAFGDQLWFLVLHFPLRCRPGWKEEVESGMGRVLLDPCLAGSECQR